MPSNCSIGFGPSTYKDIFISLYSEINKLFLRRGMRRSQPFAR